MALSSPPLPFPSIPCFLPQVLYKQGGTEAIVIISPKMLIFSLLGICVFSWPTPKRVHSSFNGLQLRLRPLRWASERSFSAPVGRIVMMVQPRIQFIQGTDELTIPEVKLTKSKDGTNGTAIFKFSQPSVFDSSKEVGDITGFYMIDEEGVIQTTSVNARFINGKPAGVEATHIMRSPREWDRFMRFMERYANANGLQFVKS